LESSFSDAIIFEARAKAKHVAASGIRGVDADGWGRKFAYIAGVLEVIDEAIGKHRA